MFQNKSVKVDGIDVSYIDEGDSKDVLLLIHGFSFKIGFTPLIEELKKDFRVIAPDLPGFGFSKEADFVCNTENYLKFLKDFLDELGIAEVSVFGNSMGGYLSLLLAHKYPSKVKKVIVRSPLVTYKQLPWQYSNKLILFVYEILSRNKLILDYFKSLFLKGYVKLATKNIKDQELYEEIRKQQENNLSATAARTILFDLAKADIRDKLPEINQQTLIIWGNKDGILNANYANELSNLLPNAKVNLKPNDVHCIVTLDVNDLATEIKNHCL